MDSSGSSHAVNPESMETTMQETKRRAARQPKAVRGLILSERERKFIDAYRRFLAAQSAPFSAPAELLEHGMMHVDAVAKWLETTPEVLVAGEWRCGYSTIWLPILKHEKTTAISEVFRAWKRLQKQRMLEVAKDAAEVLNDRRGAGEWAVDGGKPTLGIITGDVFWNVREPHFGVFDDIGSRRTGLRVEHIAKRLGVSKAAAKRLIDGPLFAVERVVTHEEIESYERKLAREAKHGKAVAA